MFWDELIAKKKKPRIYMMAKVFSKYFCFTEYGTVADSASKFGIVGIAYVI